MEVEANTSMPVVKSTCFKRPLMPLEKVVTLGRTCFLSFIFDPSTKNTHTRTHTHTHTRALSHSALMGDENSLAGKYRYVAGIDRRAKAREKN